MTNKEWLAALTAEQFYNEFKKAERQFCFDINTRLALIEWLDKKHELKEKKKVEGYWIPIESPTGVESFGIKEMTVQCVRCSVCDAEEDVSFSAYRFCPRCGSKMKGW